MMDNLETAAAAEFLEEPIPESAAEPAGNVGLQLPDFSWLRAKTGPGPIEDYVDHPMNPRGSKGIAQILRGVTGIAGDLDLAVLDIALGTIEVMKERKNAAAQPE